jgi:hypothetical protein
MSVDVTAGVSRAFLWEEFNKMGIDPDAEPLEYAKFQSSLVGMADFAEYWLRDPMDEERPLRLEPAQRAAINAIQFGYDIDSYPFSLDKVPKEIVMIWPRQFGKSTAVAIAAACAFIFMQKRFNIGLFSINLDGAVDLMKKIKVFLQYSPFAYMIESSNTTEIHKVGGKVQCVSYPASEGVRGRALSLALIDEAAKMDEEILKGTILPTLRREGKRWILLSTPRGFRGEFIRHFHLGMSSRPITCTQCGTQILQSDRELEPFSHILREEYFIPKDLALPPCPKCQSHSWIYGIGTFTVVPVDPWHCSWTTEAEIRAELDLAGWTPLAMQELLGKIIYEGSNVFTRIMLENAAKQAQKAGLTLENYPIANPMVNNYVLGIDLGKIHDASVASVMHWDYNIQKCVWDYMQTIGGKYDMKDYPTIREKMMNLVLLYNPIWLVPDSTGVGDAVVDEMFNDIKVLKRTNPWLRTKIFNNLDPKLATTQHVNRQAARKHKGFVFSGQTKADLIENLVNGYGKRMDILLPPYNIPEVHDFWEEMLAFSYEITESDHIKYGTQAAHDDRVIAHALAYWVCRRKPFIGMASTLGAKYGLMVDEENEGYAESESAYTYARFVRNNVQQSASV